MNVTNDLMTRTMRRPRYRDLTTRDDLHDMCSGLTGETEKAITMFLRYRDMVKPGQTADHSELPGELASDLVDHLTNVMRMADALWAFVESPQFGEVAEEEEEEEED